MIKIRKISITIGLLILSAFIFYGVGQSLITSAPTIGLFMILINSIIVTFIGILFKNLLRNQDKPIMRTYLAARIIEAVLLLIGGLFLYINEITDTTLMQQSFIIINKIAYNIGMISLGIGSTIVFSFCLKPRVFPKWICIWGIIGYILLVIGSLLDILNIQSSMYFLMPGGLFEITISFWLIFKGQRTQMI
ncbi:MAG: DUF4386 domain-containing protein [Spirochaetaceae bacterium]